VAHILSDYRSFEFLPAKGGQYARFFQKIHHLTWNRTGQVLPKNGMTGPAIQLLQTMK